MKFNYQGKDNKGKTQSGVIEASSREAALSLLAAHNLFVTFLEAAEARPLFERNIRFFERVSMRDIMMFSRQLSVMFVSRVPLVEALQTLASQTKSRTFKEKIFRLSEEVKGGTLFSKALSKYPDIFSPFYVNMVKSGEASGTLSSVLEYLADHMEREYHLVSKIRSALVYPAFIVFLSFTVLALLMFFVIPNLTKVLEQTGQELPAVTQFVLTLATLFRAFWWVFLLLTGGAVFFFLRWKSTPEGTRLLSRFYLKVPLLNSFLRMIYLSRFAENLSTLISGGLPIVQALDITGRIVGSSVYTEIIEEAKSEVQKGNQISTVLQKYPAEFPPVFTQMVFVGEKSGSLDKTLSNIVSFYQKEVDRTVEAFLSIIEPALIVFLGLIVGGLLASVLLPLYQLGSL
ncbi:type II secretion system F family protein [Patescibacteria group bacterium]|nr:type II secretion system F family protein [Patescibacteria group bacterium]